MLTLEQFRASKEFFKDGNSDAGLEGPGWVYANGSCYINACLTHPGEEDEYQEFFLSIYDYTWEGMELDALETILYNEFYTVEVGPSDDHIGKVSQEN